MDLAVNAIDHTKTKARYSKANSICARPRLQNFCEVRKMCLLGRLHRFNVNLGE